jgi:hypothetical protein
VIPKPEFPDEFAAANSAALRLRRLTVFGHARRHLFRPLTHGRHEPAAGTAVLLSYSIARALLAQTFWLKRMTSFVSIPT